jgi:LacI family transcriptional regulator
MTTIKDVARHAGISVTTASYALNSTGTISEATRQRVLLAAEELNYHPNAFARLLKNRKTSTIGVFISRFGGSFYEEILEGIHDTVLKTDYELIVCPETTSYSRILTHRQVDGAIVFDSKIKDETVLKLASQTFPIITLDRSLDGDYVFPVLINNQQGTQEAFSHLYDQGARNFCFISGAFDSLDNFERKQSFLDECASHGASVRVIEGNFTRASGSAAGKAILESDNLPQAVFCANDQMAIGFIQAMQENSVGVPEDIAVIGFDNIQLAGYMHPSLTTVDASRFQWGSSAVTQLINFLETGTNIRLPRIDTHLIVRCSSLIQPG